MKVYHGSQGLRLPDSAVALGDFDAIHKGHRIIIENMVSYAKKNKLLSVVYMYSVRPGKELLSINTLEKRLEILEKLGVECCVIEDFTPEYKDTSCNDFVKAYIENRLNAKGLFVGFNYRFGKMAKGDVNTLKGLCKNAEVFVIPCVKIRDIPVSSTLIRNMINQGDVLSAKEFLGRYFSVSGKVVRGKQLGRTIGFPTANIEYKAGNIIPLEGVYITRSRIGNNKYYSITNVGAKPTVMDEVRNIETAIGDFSKDIYGEEIEVEFCEYIRKIEKFESLEMLKNQLKKDMAKAKKFFAEGEKNE